MSIQISPQIWSFSLTRCLIICMCFRGYPPELTPGKSGVYENLSGESPSPRHRSMINMSCYSDGMDEADETTESLRHDMSDFDHQIRSTRKIKVQCDLFYVHSFVRLCSGIRYSRIAVLRSLLGGWVLTGTGKRGKLGSFFFKCLIGEFQVSQRKVRVQKLNGRVQMSLNFPIKTIPK